MLSSVRGNKKGTKRGKMNEMFTNIKLLAVNVYSNNSRSPCGFGSLGNLQTNCNFTKRKGLIITFINLVQ